MLANCGRLVRVGCFAGWCWLTVWLFDSGWVWFEFGFGVSVVYCFVFVVLVVCVLLSWVVLGLCMIVDLVWCFLVLRVCLVCCFVSLCLMLVFDAALLARVSYVVGLFCLLWLLCLSFVRFVGCLFISLFGLCMFEFGLC